MIYVEKNENLNLSEMFKFHGIQYMTKGFVWSIFTGYIRMLLVVWKPTTVYCKHAGTSTLS